METPVTPRPSPEVPPSQNGEGSVLAGAANNQQIALEALLVFAQDVQASVQGDRLRTLIAQRLPELVGLRDVWVFARFGNRRHIITPADPNGSFMQRLMSGQGDWATFPLKVDQEVVGVLGIGIPAQRFSPRDRRLLAAIASILARALKTSDAFETMREASIVDPLTGCLLRPEGIHRLDAELRRAARSNRPVALLLLDLDHFKGVNDRYGHNCGDAVLSAMGRIMMRTLRASDLRCRWGGEEFLVALPESSLGAARRVAEALRQRMSEMRITCGTAQVMTTASIGVALARPGELDLKRLISRADAALYQAKHAGRNCVRVAQEDGRKTAGARFRPPAGTAPAGLAFPDRRDPSRTDRRRVPSPGRRRTDPSVMAGSRRQST